MSAITLSPPADKRTVSSWEFWGRIMVLPYLAISVVLILFIILLTAWYFQVHFHNPAALALICFLFLLCSLGMGLLISAISRTQTQAIQFSVFFLLPVFVLSGADRL